MDNTILDEGFRNISPRDKAEISRLKAENFDNNDAIKNGKRAILALIFFSFAGLIIAYYVTNPYGASNSELIFEAVILVSIYTGLYIFSKNKPKGALIGALVVYLLYQILILIADPSMIIKGLLIKFFVIMYLGKGIQGSIRKEKNDARLEVLGAELN